MTNISRVLEQNRNLILCIVGLSCLLGAQAFHFTLLKVSLDHLLAEVGALLLVVGVLHSQFEMKIRNEMLKEVADSVLGNTHLYDSGLSDWRKDSKTVNEADHWGRSPVLRIGVQYSSKFADDFHAVLESRCKADLDTTFLVLTPDGKGAAYLKGTNTGFADVKGGVERIKALALEAEAGVHGRVRVLMHDRILRYSFIQTDEAVWVKFFTNSKAKATVPAFRFRAGTPMYEFVLRDIQHLEMEAAG